MAMAKQLQYILKLFIIQAEQLGSVVFVDEKTPNSHVHTFLEWPRNVYRTPSAHQSHVT